MAVLLLVSCQRQDKQAPDYDSRRVELLVDACDAVEKQDTIRALKLFESMASEYPEDSFPALASRNEQKRHLVQMANELLVTIQLNNLGALVRDTERKGVTCPELMAFTRVVDALNALRLFTQRMPWKTAGYLQQNLKQLDGYGDILNQSSSYVAFRAEQERTLARLQGDEQSQRLATAMDALDVALVTGVNIQAARAKILTFNGTYPDNPMSKCSALLASGKLEVLLAEGRKQSLLQKALEITALDKWDELPKGLQSQLLESLRQRVAVSLCGKWLVVKGGQSQDAANDFLRSIVAHPAHPVPRQEIVGAIMGKHLPTPKQLQGWPWNSPCPGAPEMIARIKQLGLK